MNSLNAAQESLQVARASLLTATAAQNYQKSNFFSFNPKDTEKDNH